jgi:hypothetical protein
MKKRQTHWRRPKKVYSSYADTIGPELGNYAYCSNRECCPEIARIMAEQMAPQLMPITDHNGVGDKQDPEYYMVRIVLSPVRLVTEWEFDKSDWADPINEMGQSGP